LKQLEGTIRIVAKTNGIKLEGSEAWINQSKSNTQNPQAFKGQEVRLDINDVGMYTNITQLKREEPEQKAALTQEDRIKRGLYLNCAARILSGGDMCIAEPEKLVQYAMQLERASKQQNYL
jgi:hypothetical protein